MRWAMLLLTLPLGGEQKWTFEKDDVDKAPAGFEFARTGKGDEGAWVVKKDGDNKVLAQTSSDKTDYRFPLAVVKDSSLKNVTLSVKIKSVSGEVDQGGGLVWRYQDKDNYYLTRLNLLEKNVRFYTVVKGKRTTLERKEEVKLAQGEWHALKVECNGASIKISLNGEEVITTTDKTFAEAGKVGVWTKADSVMYFDDLTVEDVK